MLCLPLRLLSRTSPRRFLALKPRNMTRRSTARIHGANMQGLTNAFRVSEYLEDTPFRPLSVSRIQAGTINYAYRIFLHQPLNQGNNHTAILKYFAPYMAGESVSLATERSIFEARALIHIPWQTFQYSTVLANHATKTCPRVDLPIVYSQDPKLHTLIIEDCTSKHSVQSTNTIRQLLENAIGSDEKDAIASVIGGMLGAFLAQLQSWGRKPQHHPTALELFGNNDSAKEVIIQETFTELFENLEQIGYQICGTKKSEVENRLHDLASLIREDCRSVSMGDFW